MPAAARRPTLRDIARLTGLSTSAVSIVARGERGVSEETRRRVLDTMRRLGYAARVGREGPTHRIAAAATSGRAARSAEGKGPTRDALQVLALVVERLPLPVLSDAAYAEVVGGMQAEARASGFFLALHEVESGADLRTVLQEENQYAGALLLGSGDLTDDEVLRLAAPGRPVALVDNHIPGHAIECVLPDHATAAYVATAHLIALGHQRIAFLPGPSKYKTLSDRLQGYLGAMHAHGLDVPPDLLPPPAPGSPRKGYLQMKQLLELSAPPTAVVATSDKSALGALDAIKAAGRRVPHDIALTGIDDLAEGEHAEPPLTTVRWPKRDLGVLAVRRLLDRIAQPASVPLKTLVPCHLVVRASCGASSS
jgi:DNA-binding LacI/PurR family transcriptional regulator